MDPDLASCSWPALQICRGHHWNCLSTAELWQSCKTFTFEALLVCRLISVAECDLFTSRRCYACSTQRNTRPDGSEDMMNISFNNNNHIRSTPKLSNSPHLKEAQGRAHTQQVSDMGGYASIYIYHKTLMCSSSHQAI